MKCEYRTGFMHEPFPEIEGLEILPKTYALKCRQFTVEVKVYQCKLELSKDFSFSGITTSRVDIAHRLPLNGFASYCNYDESDTMFEAAKFYCQEHGLEICQQYNNWPSLRASVNKIR